MRESRLSRALAHGYMTIPDGFIFKKDQRNTYEHGRSKGLEVGRGMFSVHLHWAGM